ncbi:YdcF family protein [Roseateles sp. BYS78W]|uniref:YdcF family protein n=1 Tax=Pelomonas candidula TaxID=3299025 RepID=A0ABW7HCT4_9BURK
MSLAFDYSGFKTLLLAAMLPPAPMLLLAAWGGWRLKRGRRGGGWMLGMALALVWLSATEVAGEWLSRAAGQPPLLKPAEVDALRGQGDGAVLVLGGGVRRQVPEFGYARANEITGERLAYGVWLARRSGWPLGFSGGIGWTATDLHQSEASIVARVVATDYGMPLRWAEGQSRDTRENAANTLPLLAKAGVRHILLVTHEEHMGRAMRAFEAEAVPLGISVRPAPVGLRPEGAISFDDWCPSTGGFERVRYVVYETLAWWAGR